MNYRQLMPASSNFSQKSAEPTKGDTSENVCSRELSIQIIR